MKIRDNGVVLHQSDLKSHCLEQLRLGFVAEGPRMETDAATVGTVLHSVIEHELRGSPFDNEGDAIQWGAEQYVQVLETYKDAGATYSMGTFENHTRALAALGWLVRSWYHSPERFDLLYKEHDSLLSEWSFDLKFADVLVPTGNIKRKFQEVPVYLAGTADIVYNNRVQDWKSASSEYKQWEYQRWGRQPDVYTWAAAKSGLIQPDKDGMYYFDFKVFVRRNEVRLPDTVTVKRSENHWAWLEVLVTRVVTLITRLEIRSPRL